MEVGIGKLSLVPLYMYIFFFLHQRGDALMKQEPVDTCVTSEKRVILKNWSLRRLDV